jgi:phosphoribosylamine--glycine ligase
VVAAHGYPMSPRQGDVISGLPADSDECMVFHAGTRQDGGQVLSSGGRVLCVTALGESVKAAQQLAYQTLSGLHFDGMQFRRDIGHRALR